MNILNQCKHYQKKRSTHLLYAIIVFTFSGLYFSCDDSVIGPEQIYRFEAGPILIVSNISGSSQLWSMNEAGADVKQLTDNPDFPVSGAKWSPDGSKIAFTSYTPGINVPYEFTQAIYLMNADGRGVRRLTNPPTGFRMSGDGGIVWSPDGKKIVFSRHIPPEVAGHFVVFIIDIETNTERLLSNEVSSVHGWFPDGDRLLVRYRIDGTRSGLGIMNMDGNLIKDLISGDTTVNNAILSPDGKTIALSYAAELHTMDSNGENLVKIKDAVYADWIQIWSPQSDRIIYMEEHKRDKAFTPKQRYFKLLNIESKEEMNVTPFDYRDLYDYENYRQKHSYITSWRKR